MAAIPQPVAFVRGALTVLALLLAAPGAAVAQGYPNKPVRMIISFTPGSTTDVFARLYADKLRASLGQAVLVENRPGANSQIAIDAVRNAEPDGYTLLLEGPSLTTLPILRKGFTLDYTKDITPITSLVQGSLSLVTYGATPFKNIDEMVAYMRANPGKLNWAASAPVSVLVADMFKNATGTKFEVVAYPGSAQAVQAIMTDQAQLNFLAVGQAKTFGDKVKILVVTGEKRSSFAPDVPAAGESSIPALRELSKFSGFAGFSYGVVGPGGLARPIANALYAASDKAVRDPEFAKRMHDLVYDIVSSNPDTYARTLATEAEMYARAAKQAGIQPQ